MNDICCKLDWSLDLYTSYDYLSFVNDKYIQLFDCIQMLLVFLPQQISEKAKIIVTHWILQSVYRNSVKTNDVIIQLTNIHMNVIHGRSVLIYIKNILEDDTHPIYLYMKQFCTLNQMEKAFDILTKFNYNKLINNV